MNSFLTIKIEISIYRRLPGYEQRIQTHPSTRTVTDGREFDAELNWVFFYNPFPLSSLLWYADACL